MSDFEYVYNFPKQIQDRIDAGIGCGSGVGPGWLDIIIELDAKIAETNPDYKIDQIKEKFGDLRFYTNEIDEAGYDAITEAEHKSAVTCELCGAEGQSSSRGGWIVTRCEEHKEI